MGVPETAVILAAHGSSADERINRPMFELAERIESKLENVLVTPAFLDGRPDVRFIVNELEPSRIVVVPFMASNGYYTDVVFKKAISHPEKQIHMAPAIGGHPDLANIVANRLSKLSARLADVEPSNSTCIVVGHGTRKNRNSCRSTIDLVKQLRNRFPKFEFQFAFIDQNPSIEHVVSRIQTRNALVVPFMMGLGPHVTHDIPQAFGMRDFGKVVFGSEFEFPFEQTIVGCSSRIEKVIYDKPIGIYPELSDLCATLVTRQLESSEWNRQEHHREVV